ncbi:adenylate/guanylate cyclase domain-containing protein [Treponema sp. OMZ 840]|uniref:adenylate/guanylate cyclase domain-containing protein n=1 Tax=Treponema sp. OMZ 840 TaxID=244313 RepID=UPI003D9248BE
MCMLILPSCKKEKATEKNTRIHKGVYNIENLQKSEIVNLEGEWIFIPNEFSNPAQDFSQYTRFESINKRWNTYSQPLPAFAYATYAVKIKGFASDSLYALKLAGPSSACAAYLDGECFFTSGKIGTNGQDERFHWGSELIILPLREKTETTLVFHISNFNDKDPGFLKPVKIAFYDTLLESHNRSVVSFTIIAGILFLLAIFFLSLFIFYPKERKALCFSILCTIFSLRMFCYDEFLLTTILPFVSGVLLHKLGYVTFSAAIIFVSFFIYELLNKKRSVFLYCILLPAFIYGIIVVFTPISLYTKLLTYIQIYILAVAVYDLVILTRSALKRDKYALFFLFGSFLFLLLAIWDMLISNDIVKGIFVAQFGILALLIPMAMIVLQSFKSTFEKVTLITRKIEQVNTALTRFLPNEFMNFLKKGHTDVKLGDHDLENMYIAFVYLSAHADLKTNADRLNLLNIYNKILAVINPIIKEHRGFIDKYLTEGLMIVFTGSAQEALNCLLKIGNFIADKNITRKQNALGEISFSCGIHYGQVMLGTIGETERMDSTAISDVVNIASRLHFYALEQKASIFLSDAVKKNYDLEPAGGIGFKYAGLVKLRGKDTPISVYEVHK